MTLGDEYTLSEYETIGALGDSSKVFVVRNRINGRICIKKTVSPGQREIYDFLIKNPSPFTPEIAALIEDGEKLILIEEYITGRDIESIVREGCLEGKEAMYITAELCRCLAPLHNAKPQIICRDLKAENVMISENGDVKLVDFDIARVYRPGLKRDTRLLGTEDYAAPEQFGFRQTDGRTDIYALGVLLNYMLTGCFPSERITEGRLHNIVTRCTELDPDDRYQSVEELESALLRTEPGLYSVKKGEGGERSCRPGLREIGRKINEYMIPGFRTRTPWKMFAATVVYIAVADICFTTEFTQDGSVLPGVHMRFEQLILWLSQMIFIAVAFNYRGWRDRLSFVNSENKFIRIISLAVFYFMIVILALAVSELAGFIWS